MRPRPRGRSGAPAGAPPGPRAARSRERFREFVPPEMLDVEPPDEDEEDGEPASGRPEHLRLVRGMSEPMS